MPFVVKSTSSSTTASNHTILSYWGFYLWSFPGKRGGWWIQLSRCTENCPPPLLPDNLQDIIHPAKWLLGQNPHINKICSISNNIYLVTYLYECLHTPTQYGSSELFWCKCTHYSSTSFHLCYSLWPLCQWLKDAKICTFVWIIYPSVYKTVA